MALSAAARRFLDEQCFAVLAITGGDGVPRQTVMWYELRGDTVIMNTAAGRLKDKLLRRDSRASICVAVGYTFVTIVGTIHVIDDPTTAQEDIRRLAVRNHGEEEGNRQSREEFSKQQRVSLYMSIERVLEWGLDG
jgi:PPOX class probable F420-dependent enzyme